MKYGVVKSGGLMTAVALFTKAWIEIDCLCILAYLQASPSSRGRGLKYQAGNSIDTYIRSPSLRGRGLKFVLCLLVLAKLSVALFTRAWIEIAG